MKIVISESFRGNLTALIPSDNMSCMELVTGLISSSRRADSDFGRQIRAAKFVFDAAAEFRPQEFAANAFSPELLRQMKTLPTIDEGGKPISLEDWQSLAVRDLQDYASSAEINAALHACMPSRMINEDCVILSEDPFITAAHIQKHQKLSKESLLYLLATAGIDIALPSIVARSNDDIDRLKQEFEEERLDYLQYINKSLDAMLAATTGSSPDLTSIYDFARDKFAIDLKLKSKKLAAIAGKKGKKVKDSLFSEFLNQAPTIAAATFRLDFVGAGQALFKSLLSAASGEREVAKALTEHKEAAYLYRISSLKV